MESNWLEKLFINEAKPALNRHSGSGGGSSSGGAELNIAYGDTPPEDTSKLWVKTSKPTNIVITTDTFVKKLSERLTSKWYGTRSVATIGSKIYMFGGYGKSSSTKNARCFDSETETFSSIPNTGFESYSGCASAVGSKIYIFLGSTTNNLYNDQIRVYDTETQAYTTFGLTLPSKSYGHACTTVDNYIYIFGGFYSNAYLKTIYRLDVETEVLTTLDATLPSGASSPGCVCIGTKIYLLGGDTGAYQALRGNYCFDTDTETVTTLASIPITLEKMGCYAVDDTIYLVGGLNQNNNYQYFSRVYAYDVNNNAWSVSYDMIYKNQYDAIYGSVGPKLYMFGGSYAICGTDLGECLDVNVFQPYAIPPKGELEITINRGGTSLPLLEVEGVKLNLPVYKVYKGIGEDKSEEVEAYLYENGSWTLI